MNKSKKIPISIVTGFLGSGKTTLISNLIKQPNMDKVALIINEFGEVGLDNLLIQSSIENTLLLENGCICCSIRGDLVDTIIDLFTKVDNNEIPKFNRIVIETTGLAKPEPIISTINNDIVISKKCFLNNVIVLVDGANGTHQIRNHQEAKVQIAQSSLCLISKCDIATDNEIDKLEHIILSLNPIATFKRIKQGIIDPDELFRFMSVEPLIIAKPHVHDHQSISQFEHGSVTSWSLIQEQSIDEKKLRNWLLMLFSLRPSSMLRLKGIIKLKNQELPLLLQAVGPNFDEPLFLNGWPSPDTLTRLIIIFKDLNKNTVEESFFRWVLKK